MGASTSNTPDVLEALRKGILSGEYLPSQTLTEASLCAHFGASRTTVKKALLLLEKEGLVSIEPNKSARVRAFTPQEVLELLEVRLVLERFVVRDAAAHITPRQLDALEQLLDEMKQAIGQKDLGGYSRCNQQLHQVIYSACSNRSAAELLCSVKARISRFDLKTILLPGRDRQSLAEHAALCQALREGSTASPPPRSRRASRRFWNSIPPCFCSAHNRIRSVLPGCGRGRAFFATGTASPPG